MHTYASKPQMNPFLRKLIAAVLAALAIATAIPAHSEAPEIIAAVKAETSLRGF